MTAVDRAGGLYSVRRRRIVVKRTAPIPGAGRSRRVRTKRPVRLDGSNSRAAKLPPSLRYRWRIVRKPRGSRAKLRRATSRHPRLRPDLPGRYRLRMTVVERIPGRGRALAAARAAASDTTTIAATPDGSGIGVPIDTTTGRQVTVGDQAYRPPTPAYPLQLVALDRATLELVTNASFTGDQAGTASLAQAVSELSPKTIAIVASRAPGNGRGPLTDQGALANVNSAAKALGGRAITAAAALTAGSCFEDTPVCGGFSIIGTPGSAAGEGTVNPGLGASEDSTGGALTGYLQLDQSGTLFSFVQGDRVAFDTTAPGTTVQQAAIRVGDTTYKSKELTGAGLYVLVLDAGSLRFREDGTFQIAGGPIGPIVQELQAATLLVEKYRDDPSALVFVQTINKITRWDTYEGNTDVSAWWARFVQDLQDMGSHKTLLHGLDRFRPNYDGTYAQVGPGGPMAASWGKAATLAATRTPGQLSGTLARNDSSQFYADNAAASPDFGDELTVLAYQDAQPWPMRDTAGRRAALQCVAKQLRLPAPIEDNYINQNLVTDWGNQQDALDGLRYSDLPGCDTSGFTAQDLSDVTRQLDQEFEAVPVVWALVNNLQRPFLLQGGSSELSLAHIADDVRNSIKPPQAPVRYDGLAIAEELLYVLGALPFVGEGADAIELIAAGIGLVDDTTLDDDGTPALSPISQSDVDSFAEQLADQYRTAALHFDQIGEILVGDWGKLNAAATNAVGPWAWTTARTERATNGLGFSARRFAFEVFFPKAYAGMLRGTNGDSSLGIPDDTSQYQCWQYERFSSHHPFYPFKTPQFGGVTPVVAPGPAKENWVFSTPTEPNDGGGGEGNAMYDDFSATLPPASLTTEMFATNAPEAPMPPLQQLEFILAIRLQLKVLSVTRSTGESEGDDLYNQCSGNLTGWPGGL